MDHDNFLQALLSFLLLLQLRRTLKTFSPNPEWQRWLKLGMIGVGVLFVVDTVLPFEVYTQWLWYLALFWIISLAFKYPFFEHSRMVMHAVIPLVIVTFFDSIIGVAFHHTPVLIKTLIGLAYAAAVTWLIAQLILSRRQTKALKEEQRKRLEEEEEHRMVAARKAELEAMVAERTAELMQQKEELQHALKELEATQAQLIQREKMASLGELTAGIAHEIKNPLNFINNFSELNAELTVEIQERISRLDASHAEKISLVELLNDLEQNLQKIQHHGTRADAIVKSMLLHSRASSHQKEPTDINALVDEYLRLCYHGLRAKDKTFNVHIETDFDPEVKAVPVNGQDIGRVLLNLYTNAFYAVNQKQKHSGREYEPTVRVSTKKRNGKIEIRVKDNGTGIPAHVLNKIYQPFFTTKPTGEGTGLGLSLSYDIITKGHGGELKVETKENEGAEFIVQLPAA